MIISCPLSFSASSFQKRTCYVQSPVVITPGNIASTSSGGAFPCTNTPGTEPIPSTISISADFLPSPNVSVLVLGYGCVYQGGFLFAVNEATPNTQSIGGKVGALTDEAEPSFQWATIPSTTTTAQYSHYPHTEKIIFLTTHIKRRSRHLEMQLFGKP